VEQFLEGQKFPDGEAVAGMAELIRDGFHKVSFDWVFFARMDRSWTEHRVPDL
jgi:hypothetical protein